MIYLRWLSVFVFSFVTVYLAIWVGGGVGELFITRNSGRDTVVAVVAIVGISLIVIGTLMLFFRLTSESTECGIALALWLVMSIIYAAVIDPIVTYGVFPWQWWTGWSIVPLGFGLIMFFQIMDEIELERSVRKRLGF